MAYDDIIGRTDTIIPEPVAADIIQDAIHQSIVLNRARRVPMSSATQKQPVLTALPEAYWVQADTGLKETTDGAWAPSTLTAEELAAIVVIPDAVYADSSIDMWGALRPLIAEAMGAKIDAAAIFGTDAPTSWPDGLVPGAVAAGNTMAAGTDIGTAVANLAAKIASTSGYSVNGFIVPPGQTWRLLGMRASDGHPIYNNGQLYGMNTDELRNGTWPVTTPTTELVEVDWTKVLIGVRQDITVKMLDQAVLTDATGKVLINLAQQDCQAMRVVMRVGFQVTAPATRIAGAAGTKYPAGVVQGAA